MRQNYFYNENIISMIQHTDAAMFLVDVNLKYIAASPAFAALFGYDDPANMIGKNKMEVFKNKETAIRLSQEDAEQIESKKGTAHSTICAEIADKAVYFDLLKFLVYNAEKKIIGIFGTLCDVTRQKQDEYQRNMEAAAASEYQRQIEDERMQYREALLHNAHYSYLVDLTENSIKSPLLSEDPLLNYESLGFTFPMGYDEYLTAWNSKYKMEHTFPENADWMITCAGLLEAYEENQRHLEFEYCIPILGAYRRKTVLLSKNSETGHIFASVIIKDISPERQKELAYQRELLTANEAALAANNAKTEFLSRMSHDIRTPMNAILNIAALAMDDIGDERKLRADLEKIRLSGDFLLGLINDILDMNRIESGHISLVPVIYPKERFFGYLDSVMIPLFAAKNIKFTIRSSNLIPAVYVDELRLNQIFFNVLSNAAKYTPEGGEVSFEINVININGKQISAEFIVKDNGIGMSKAFLEKAFIPFEREQTAAAYTGTGLGLPITKAIVEALGGTILLESQQGKGTTVTICMTLAIPSAEEIKDLQADKLTEVHDIPPANSGRILVAEDHPLNREVIVRLLQKRGFETVCAENGEEALAILKASKVGELQLVLMDVRMPVMDGIEATRQIRILPDKAQASIPIVAMTADAFSEDRDRCLAAGMDDYLSKPINVSELNQVLEKIAVASYEEKRDVVLVVDDSEVNRSIIEAALCSEFEILTAENGEMALEQLEKSLDIVAVITDLQMPVMDGTELIRRIRSVPKYDHIAILANTQYGDPEQEDELLRIGTDDFVYKPSSPNLIITRLHNVLHKNKN